MSLTVEQTQEIVSKYQRSEGDTGSARILDLADHFKVNIHDHHSRQGLLKMVSGRRKMLDYLKKKDITRYRELIASLGLRR